jgi:hypothetical protein
MRDQCSGAVGRPASVNSLVTYSGGKAEAVYRKGSPRRVVVERL